MRGGRTTIEIAGREKAAPEERWPWTLDEIERLGMLGLALA
jgi:hypothetical protein